MKFSTGILTMMLFSAMMSPQLGRAAGDDSCDDYINRHERADLAPTGIQLGYIAGSEVSPPQQAVHISVKNVGNLSMGLTHQQVTDLCKQRQKANPQYICTSFDAATQFKISLNGKTYNAAYEYEIAGGETRVITILVPLNTFKRCEKITTHIDVTKTAGQHGCACYANDSAVLTAIMPRTPACRALELLDMDEILPAETM